MTLKADDVKVYLQYAKTGKTRDDGTSVKVITGYLTLKDYAIGKLVAYESRKKPDLYPMKEPAKRDDFGDFENDDTMPTWINRRFTKEGIIFSTNKFEFENLTIPLKGKALDYVTSDSGLKSRPIVLAFDPDTVQYYMDNSSTIKNKIDFVLEDPDREVNVQELQAIELNQFPEFVKLKQTVFAAQTGGVDDFNNETVEAF